MKLEDIKITVNQDSCIGCGECVKDCPSKVLVLENNKATLTRDHCLKCAHCFAICPTRSIAFDGTNDNIISKNDHYGLNEEQLLNHLKLRRSIRHFSPAKPTREELKKVIEAGRLTPTASNSQNVRYIVIDENINELEDLVLEEYRNVKADSLRSYERGFLFQGAPVAILIISSHIQNANLASMSMELMGESIGLGCLYVGLFTRPANSSPTIRHYLNISEEEHIVTCLVFGYAEVHYQRSAPKLPANITWNIK